MNWHAFAKRPGTFWDVLGRVGQRLENGPGRFGTFWDELVPVARTVRFVLVHLGMSLHAFTKRPGTFWGVLGRVGQRLENGQGHFGTFCDDLVPVDKTERFVSAHL